MNKPVNHPEQDNTNDETLGEKLILVLPYPNDHQLLLLAAEARSLGHGGISRVSPVTGILRPTIPMRITGFGV